MVSPVDPRHRRTQMFLMTMKIGLTQQMALQYQLMTPTQHVLFSLPCSTPRLSLFSHSLLYNPPNYTPNLAPPFPPTHSPSLPLFIHFHIPLPFSPQIPPHWSSLAQKKQLQQINILLGFSCSCQKESHLTSRKPNLVPSSNPHPGTLFMIVASGDDSRMRPTKSYPHHIPDINS